MTSSVLIGVLLIAAGVAWAVYSFLPRLAAASKPPTPSVNEPTATQTDLKSRLQALAALESLLTWMESQKNQAGVKAIQDAIAAVVKVEVKP